MPGTRDKPVTNFPQVGRGAPGAPPPLRTGITAVDSAKALGQTESAMLMARTADVFEIPATGIIVVTVILPR